MSELRAALAAQQPRPDGRHVIRDVVAVTQFAGQAGVTYPNVPIAEGIDLQALTDGDPDPFFVTLRIGEIDAVSLNGHYFDESFVRDLVQQTIDRRATGIMGHLKDEDRGSAYPLPSIYWVGAQVAGKFAWGKGYIPPDPVREYMRRRMAQRGEVATSLYGTADELMYVEAREAWKPVGFVLESLDLAPPERAGVPSLAVVPYITSAMAQETTPHKEPEPMADKLDVLRALTAEDAKLLPDAVVKAIEADSDASKRLTAVEGQIAELRAALGLADDADLVATVKAQHETIAQQQAATVTATIAALVNNEEHGVKVKSMRPVVLDLVNAENPTTADEAKAAFERVMDREHVKALLQAEVERQMGGRQRRPVEAKTTGTRQFVVIPDDETT